MFTIRIQLRANLKFWGRSKLPQHGKHFIVFKCKIAMLNQVRDSSKLSCWKTWFNELGSKGKNVWQVSSKEATASCSSHKDNRTKENYCKATESYKQLCPRELRKVGHITCTLPALPSGENTNKTTCSAELRCSKSKLSKPWDLRHQSFSLPACSHCSLPTVLRSHRGKRDEGNTLVK